MAVAISELMKAIQKSGLPLADPIKMRQALPGAEQAIGGQMQSNPQLDQLKANFRAQLDRVAQMDQRLAGVYGDPSSKLYIENPMKRQALQSGAASTGFQAVNMAKSQAKGQEKEIESNIKDAVSLYKDLIAEEKAQAKGKKTAGNKTKGGKAKINDLKDEIRNGVGDSIYIYDADAMDFFSGTSAKFQNDWIKKAQEGRLRTPGGKRKLPGQGYTKEDIKKLYDKYRESFKAPSKPKTNTDQEELANLIEQISQAK